MARTIDEIKRELDCYEIKVKAKRHLLRYIESLEEDIAYYNQQINEDGDQSLNDYAKENIDTYREVINMLITIL